MGATADVEAGNGNRASVAPEDTVPPKVEFENRTATDKWWAVAYVLSYIAFLSTGSFIASQAHDHDLYTYNEDGYRSGIGEHFLEDVQTCCGDQTSGGLCFYLNADSESRRLQERNSKFDGDEGIFDAFLEAPEIIIGLTALAFAIAITWTIALRFFSKPIVILAELCKIGLFVWGGVALEDPGARIVCFLIAAGLAVYAAWARNKILFAAKVIKHSTIAMKENPSIFVGSALCMLLFAGNAGLFVFFFAQSFKVTEVRNRTYSNLGYAPGVDTSGLSSTTTECYYGYPSYVGGIGIYQCISYLWTVLLFEKFRLSIIAAIVGSWHFHPENKPTVWGGIKNIGPSFGTLSISSLITSLAEYMNKLANQRGLCHWCSPAIVITGPLILLMCLCSGLKILIQMLTKYAVILHSFTGQNFVGSAKTVFKILSRHFKGGFVTEVTSKSVLNLASYGFSLGIGMLTWKWVDDRFDCGTLGIDNSTFQVFAYMLLLLFTAWYPVLGIYLIILADQWLREFAGGIEDPSDAWNHHWIPPLAACFVACIAMLLFSFLSKVFLDIIDTLFLCFAIDKDNNVSRDGNEFESIVKELPTYATEVESVKSEDEIVPVPVAVSVYDNSSAPALAD